MTFYNLIPIYQATQDKILLKSIPWESIAQILGKTVEYLRQKMMSAEDGD